MKNHSSIQSCQGDPCDPVLDWVVLYWVGVGVGEGNKLMETCLIPYL